MKTHVRQLTQSMLGFILLAAMSGVNAAVVGLNPSVLAVTEGDTFDVQIVAGEFAELAGGTVDFSFDEDILDVVSVVVDSRWDFAPASGNPSGPGRWQGIGFDVFANDPLRDVDGTIATITFFAQAIGQAAIDIADSSMFFSTTTAVALDSAPLSAQISVDPVAVVPVPAALPLMLSALGLAGWLRSGRRPKSR